MTSGWKGRGERVGDGREKENPNQDARYGC